MMTRLIETSRTTIEDEFMSREMKREVMGSASRPSIHSQATTLIFISMDISKKKRHIYCTHKQQRNLLIPSPSNQHSRGRKSHPPQTPIPFTAPAYLPLPLHPLQNPPTLPRRRSRRTSNPIKQPSNKTQPRNLLLHQTRKSATSHTSQNSRHLIQSGQTSHRGQTLAFD